MINESADSLNDVAALLLWTIGWREEELQTYYCGTAMIVFYCCLHPSREQQQSRAYKYMTI